MRDFNTKTWGIYAKLICNLYNKDYDLFTTKTIITLDKNKDLYIE